MSNTDTNETTDTTAAIGHNKPEAALKKLLNRAAKYGELSNKGDSALPTLARDVVSNAADGALSVNLTRAAKGPDDIVTIYEAYLAARVKAKNVTAPSAQISKLRAIAKTGARFGAEGATVIERADDLWIKAYNNEEQRKLMVKGSRYDFMVKIAVAQNEAIPDDTPRGADIEDLLFDDNEIEGILFGAVEQAEKTPAERVKKLFDQATKLIEGSFTKEGEVTREPIDNQNLTYAAEYLKAAWSDLDPEAANKAAEEEKKQAAVMQMMTKDDLRKLLKAMH